MGSCVPAPENPKSLLCSIGVEGIYSFYLFKLYWSKIFPSIHAFIKAQLYIVYM